MAKDLSPEIKAEIQRVLEKFGVRFLEPEEKPPDGKEVVEIKLDDKRQVNCILEQRGADKQLLYTIGSWKDTTSDEQTLCELREWNENGTDSLQPEVSFGTTEDAA
jgi:hypothetical protein